MQQHARSLSRLVLFLLSISAATSACAAPEPVAPEPAESASAAEPTAPKPEDDIDRERLARGIDAVRALQGSRSLLVMRGDEIVAEESFVGGDVNRRPWNVKSASKTFLSALVGIALDRGWIESLDATVAELLPSYAADLSADKKEIRLRDLLSMQAGLASTSQEHYGAWVAHDDWVAAALARPLRHERGEEFRYSTGDTHLISAILTEATGRSTRDLAQKELFDPLGVEIHHWQRAPEGYFFGGNNVKVTPRDLAHFGRLYLQGGEWDGRQIVPRKWVETSTEVHAEGWPERYGAFGYHWWIPPDDPRESFAAIGFGTQLLYVVPEIDMLVVHTATHVSKGEEWDARLFEILRDDVFGAVR